MLLWAKLSQCSHCKRLRHCSLHVPDVSVFTVELENAVDGGKVLVPDKGVGWPVNMVVELQVTAVSGAD